jgi:diaminopimelate epimerase
MKPIKFFKMSGCGNDFIFIDNRKNAVDVDNISDFVKKICRRRMSVGADGLMLIENSRTADFKWRFFNSDGSLAEMCGNGARCAARFACENGIAGQTMSFETEAGIICAEASGERVRIKMTNPSEVEGDITLGVGEAPVEMSFVNTGVPHVVIFKEDVHGLDIIPVSREIRFHKRFAPSGTNVNFVGFRDDGVIDIRTYERGVEDETLACGTGAVAGAIVLSLKTGQKSPLSLKTKSGGMLTIYFSQQEGRFTDVFLEGDARIIYTGELNKDAWEYD